MKIEWTLDSFDKPFQLDPEKIEKLKDKNKKVLLHTWNTRLEKDTVIPQVGILKDLLKKSIPSRPNSLTVFFAYIILNTEADGDKINSKDIPPIPE
jgi:hypothetical protein